MKTESFKSSSFKVFFIILFALFTINVSCQDGASKSKIKNVSAKDFKELLNKKEGNLIDVRTMAEYNTGHIANAHLIDLHSDNFKNSIDTLDKSIPVFVYCRTGHRSSMAAEIFKSSGFKHIYNLEGGITEWKNKEFPVVK